ncbi:glycosyltransferase [Candidatus Parvarchaeota archaeon]|nr:glycosyltransferase [Candidatus Parvarchaeota archaeon]
MKNYVVIPTYKEADNLKELLPLLTKYNVIIVDDNSLDGTENLCRKYKNVKLLVRKGKRGLASAVMDGIRSIKENDAKVVVADADFEHDYGRIKDVFNLLDKNDFVECVKVGKRLWNRGIISTTAKRLLYMLVPESTWLRDPMSGFFGFRTKSVSLNGVKPQGYKIMLEIFMNLKKGSRKTHLEYTYGYRKHGKSKLKPKVIMEFIEQMLRLNNYRVLVFLVIGIFGIFLNELLLYVFYLKLPLFISLVYAIVISTLVNFLMNHYITFKRRSNFIPSILKFSLVTFVAGLINLGVAFYLSFVIMYLIANLVGIVLSFIFKYLLSENFIWSTSKN